MQIDSYGQINLTVDNFTDEMYLSLMMMKNQLFGLFN